MQTLNDSHFISQTEEEEEEDDNYDDDYISLYKRYSCNKYEI